MDPDGNEDAASFLQKLQNLYHQQAEVDRIVMSVTKSGAHFVLTEELIRRLHRIGMAKLLMEAGDYRVSDVTLTNSPHKPAHWTDVPAFMGTMCGYVNNNWQKRDLIHLSAYCLWRINWIHPFRNGNGRTSRAVSYLVMCARHGELLPAKNTVVQQIVQNKQQYQQALRQADTIYAQSNNVDQAMAPLEAWITHLLTEQLKANFQD